MDSMLKFSAGEKQTFGMEIHFWNSLKVSATCNIISQTTKSNKNVSEGRGHLYKWKADIISTD